METSSKLSINESPLVVLPSLVKVIGLERAIILQQIQYLLQLPKSGQVLDDNHKYIWNTAKDFAEFFTFWQPETIAKHLRQLETDGLLISQQPRKSEWDRTKYYRINYDQLAMLLKLQSNVYARTGSILDEETVSNVDADTGSSSQKTSSKTSNKDIHPHAQDQVLFTETETLLDYRFKTEVNETLSWLLSKKGVHKRNLPTIEWLNWFQDLEAEKIDLKGFKEFYEFCEATEWIQQKRVGITPNVMRRELENFKNRGKQRGELRRTTETPRYKSAAERNSEQVVRNFKALAAERKRNNASNGSGNEAKLLGSGQEFDFDIFGTVESEHPF